MHDETVFFGKFRLDVAARELRDGDSPVDLQPRVFDLLAYLIEHRDRAVDKNEIQDAVWRGRIVTETALTRAIMKARRAIGDSADQQSMIRTVHGHGYQFVAEVRGADSAAPEPDPVSGSAATAAPHSVAPGPTAVVPPPAASSRRGVAVLTAIVAAAAVLAYALWPRAYSADGVRIAVAPVINATDDEEFTWASLGLMGVANDLL
ncbi:MAG: transcriptional regulator, partial [Pseudomonadota bacterium]